MVKKQGNNEVEIYAHTDCSDPAFYISDLMMSPAAGGAGLDVQRMMGEVEAHSHVQSRSLDNGHLVLISEVRRLVGRIICVEGGLVCVHVCVYVCDGDAGVWYFLELFSTVYFETVCL